MARTRALLAPASSSISTPSPSNISISFTPHYLSLPKLQATSSSYLTSPSSSTDILHPQEEPTNRTITPGYKMPPRRLFGPPYTLPGNSKGKAPAVDFGQDNDDSSSVDRSREQSSKTKVHTSSAACNKTDLPPGLCTTPGPQATDPVRPRKRMSGMMADLKEAQAAKRARKDANTPGQYVGPTRPTVEDVEDEGEEPTDQPDHRGHRAVNNQSGDQTQTASHAAGKKIEAGPSRVVQDPPQGSRNAQSGKS